ncbi:MAG: 50S ribosomal protein L18Ae [Pyrobaculum sp.]
MPKIYRVSGVTTTGMKFTIEVSAEKPYDAIEMVYSLLGSRHRLSRTQIRIREVAAIALDEVRSERIKTLMALDKVIKYV